jgi:hypothetical protein
MIVPRQAQGRGEESREQNQVADRQFLSSYFPPQSIRAGPSTAARFYFQLCVSMDTGRLLEIKLQMTYLAEAGIAET